MLSIVALRDALIENLTSYERVIEPENQAYLTMTFLYLFFGFFLTERCKILYCIPLSPAYKPSGETPPALRLVGDFYFAMCRMTGGESKGVWSQLRGSGRPVRRPSAAAPGASPRGPGLAVA